MAEVGSGPSGQRWMIGSAENGSLEGERIKAKFVSGFGTGVFGPDGWSRFEIRTHFVTDDGAALYVAFDGLVELNEKTRAANELGGSSEFGDHKMSIVLRAESGHPKYLWLNHTIFVGEGWFLPEGFEYRVYRLN
jgi:hypothetical protein